MERRSASIASRIDWVLIIIFLLLVTAGWLNIFAVVYSPDSQKPIWDLDLRSGKQMLWIFSAFFIVTIMLLLEVKLFIQLAYPIYFAALFLSIVVIFMGRDIQGAKSWFDLGFMRFQPAEVAKYATALALARYLSDPSRAKLMKWQNLLPALMIMFAPSVIIIAQNETGSALVFAALIIVLYREGLPDYIMGLGLLVVTLFLVTLFFKTYLDYILIAITVLGLLAVIVRYKKRGELAMIITITIFSLSIVKGVDFFVKQVLKPHQQSRIEVLINPDDDKYAKGAGWQIKQSKIAIGSGGFWGKGFLEGTQTKFDFVPDQSTDFIFCTIGEEHGWIGSSLVVIMFVVLLFRLITLAERQKTKFSRIYGYCVASIIFFHFTINIGMTIGLFPVIGIPLPFFSYGGSALWTFTVLLFTMVKLDMYRRQVISV
jgi:rod shape determining protein RodA